MLREESVCTVQKKTRRLIYGFHDVGDIETMMANLTTVHLQRQRSPVALANYFDAAYMLAKEEMPFTKYPAIVELEKRHGVSLGSMYGTDPTSELILSNYFVP